MGYGRAYPAYPIASRSLGVTEQIDVQASVFLQASI